MPKVVRLSLIKCMIKLMKYVFILYAKFIYFGYMCPPNAKTVTNAVNAESFLNFCTILSLAKVVDFIFLHLRVLTKLSKDTFTGVRWLCSI